jgi:lipid-binding SYLF domain-containing protein
VRRSKTGCALAGLAREVTVFQGVLVALGLAAFWTAPADETTLVASATEIVGQIQPIVSDALWSRARCLVVVPDVDPAGSSAGEPARGLMSCRAGSEWSAPVFFQMVRRDRVSGAMRAVGDVVLLVLNESGVQLLLQDQAVLVPGTSVPGPVGAVDDEDRLLAAEMVSYVRVRGTFGGIDLSGAVVRSDSEANKRAYGQTATTRRILASRELSAPSGSTAFLGALRVLPGASQPGQAQAGSMPGPSGGPPTGDLPPRSGRDVNLRTRITEIRQTLDRLLADAAPSATGTSGTPAGPSEAPVTVDRARLLQLRQQFEALVLALNAEP